MQAVFSSNGAKFVVSGSSTFDRNLVSIHAENGNFATSSISGTTFKCTGSTLKPPYSSQRSSNHIELNNVSNISIGGSVINNFENSAIGIISTDSYCNVTNNNFTNHTNCIRSVNAIPSNISMLYATQNVFSNSSYGVYIQGGSLSTIASNSFQSTRTGIMAKECISTSYINYFSNQMNNVTMGIYLLQNAGAIMSISDNTIITAQDPRAGGIKVVESTTLSSNGAFVSKNNIESYGNFGVWYQNNEKGGINDNSIKLKPFTSFLNPNRYCIRVENSKAETITCNGLEGENTSLLNVPSFGLSLTYTPENLIDCNSSSRTRTAMEFIGDCDKSTIQGNTFNYHKYGLYVGADVNSQQGVIGDQTLNQNNETRGNRYQGFNNSGNFPTGYALYRYHPSFATYAEQFWTGANAGIDIYTPQSSGANFGGNEINPSFHSEPPYECPTYCQNMV